MKSSRGRQPGAGTAANGATPISELAKAPETPLSEAIAAHLQRLAVDKRAPASTLTGARTDLRRFLEFAGERGLQTPEAVDVHQLRSYIARRRKLGISPISLRRELSTLRSFFKELNRRGLLQQNPALQVRAPKAPRKLPSTFEKDPLIQALEVAPQGDIQVRDHCIAELLYGCGLRLSELHALRVSDFSSDASELRVTGKGSKTRLLPVGRKAQAAVAAWLAVRNRELPAAEHLSGPLFPGRGTQSISKVTIAKALKAWAIRTGLHGRVHPHRFRHAFATHILEESGDLRGVQELLGHANLATTQIYTHLDFEKLMRVYDDAHPRARRDAQKNVALQHQMDDKIGN